MDKVLKPLVQCCTCGKMEYESIGIVNMNNQFSTMQYTTQKNNGEKAPSI